MYKKPINGNTRDINKYIYKRRKNKMKNLRNLVITYNNSYMNSTGAIRIACILSKFKIYTKIEVVGKNKCSLIFMDANMEDKKYNELKKFLNVIDCEIYNINDKHKKRINNKKHNERRIQEEIKYNNTYMEAIN